MGRDYKRGDSDATTCRGFMEHLTELSIQMDSLDLSGMDEMRDIRRALLKKMEGVSTCIESTSASSGQAAYLPRAPPVRLANRGKPSQA